MSAVHRYLEAERAMRQTAIDTAYRAVLAHLESCTAECSEQLAEGPPARCPEGAALHEAHRTARDAS